MIDRDEANMPAKVWQQQNAKRIENNADYVKPIPEKQDVNS